MNDHEVNIGILGLGTVGTGVAKILLTQQELLKTRSSLTFKLKSIAEVNWNVERDLNLDGIQCLTDADQILTDPEIDIVVHIRQ